MVIVSLVVLNVIMLAGAYALISWLAGQDVLSDPRRARGSPERSAALVVAFSMGVSHRP